jgi:hypothetical protein
MVDIVSRALWGARYGRGFGPAPLPASEVWLHHSVTAAPPADVDSERAAMRALENIGQQRFGGGISYTFAVMPSGRVYEGHGVDRQGAHTANRNSIARAIVLVGNYDTSPVTDAQQRAVAALLQHGQQAGWWRTARLNGGHQQAPGAQTACPGRHAMAVIPTINRAAAAPAQTEEEDVKPFQDLMLAREAKGEKGSSWPAVYVGNGIVRRHVANETDLTNLQYRIERAGGDPAVQEGWAAGSLAGVLGVLVKEEN